MPLFPLRPDGRPVSVIRVMIELTQDGRIGITGPENLQLLLDTLLKAAVSVNRRLEVKQPGSLTIPDFVPPDDARGGRG